MRKHMFQHALAEHRTLAMAWAAVQVFGSRIVGQAAGVLTAVIAARVLGPEAFGLYSVGLVATVLLAQFPGSGLDMTAVRLSARDRDDAPERARGTLVLAARVKCGLGALIAVVGLLVINAPAWQVIARPELAAPLRAAVLAAVALAATEYAIAALQVYERFGRILSVSIVIAVLKFMPIVALAMLGHLTLARALIAFVLATYLGGAASLFAARSAFHKPRVWDNTTVRQVFGFGRWLVLATLLGALTSSLDVLMLSYLVGAKATGIYASGRTLALPIALAGAAVGAVLLPRLSRMPREQIGSYVGAVGARVALGCVMVGIVLVVAAPFGIAMLYGPDYGGAVAPFRWLAVAYLAQVLTWPPLTVLMVYDRPDLLVLLSVIMLVFVTVGYVLVAPVWGATGVAMVYCAGCVLMIAPHVVLARRLMRQTTSNTVPTAHLSTLVEDA